LRHHTDIPNGEIRVGWMSSSIAKRTDLLEPRWLDIDDFRRDPARCVLHRLVIARLAVRHQPSFARARIVRAHE
jgi:hypothetical protein